MRAGRTHLKGRRVARKVSLSMSGSSTAYGPPSASSSSRNCVSGGTWRAVEPHSGVIHHSLQRAHARKRSQRNCSANRQPLRNKDLSACRLATWAFVLKQRLDSQGCGSKLVIHSLSSVAPLPMLMSAVSIGLKSMRISVHLTAGLGASHQATHIGDCWYDEAGSEACLAQCNVVHGCCAIG